MTVIRQVNHGQEFVDIISIAADAEIIDYFYFEQLATSPSVIEIAIATCAAYYHIKVTKRARSDRFLKVFHYFKLLIEVDVDDPIDTPTLNWSVEGF